MPVIYGNLNLFDSTQHFLLVTDEGETPLEIETTELGQQLIDIYYNYDVNTIYLSGPSLYLQKLEEDINILNETQYANNRKVEVLIDD